MNDIRIEKAPTPGETASKGPLAADDPAGGRALMAEGRFEVVVTMADGTKETYEKDKRRIEIVGGRVVLTNLWTHVITILPANAVVNIFP